MAHVAQIPGSASLQYSTALKMRKRKLHPPGQLELVCHMPEPLWGACPPR